MAAAPSSFVGETGKAPSISAVQASSASTNRSNDMYKPRTRWERIQQVIWDGGERSPKERKLVQRLDLHVMSWATFGYFIRLLDSTNISRQYFHHVDVR